MLVRFKAMPVDKSLLKVVFLGRIPLREQVMSYHRGFRDSSASDLLVAVVTRVFDHQGVDLMVFRPPNILYVHHHPNVLPLGILTLVFEGIKAAGGNPDLVIPN